jgi:hypothetical protein
MLVCIAIRLPRIHMNQLIMIMRQQYRAPCIVTERVSVHLSIHMLQSPSDGDVCRGSGTVDTAAARQTLCETR